MENPEREKLLYALKIDPAKRSEKKRKFKLRTKIFLALLLLALVFFVFWIKRRFDAPLIEVIRAQVFREGLPPVLLSAGGYLQADSTILVSSQINGKLKSLYVDEGKLVKKDDVLGEIEDDDYRAKLNLSEAELELARATFSRKQSLYQAGVIAKAEYDQSLRAMKVAEAQRESAAYYLQNTKIRAPIDGTVVKKEKEVGEFLLPGITSEGVPGSALLKIADLRLMNVELEILETDLQKISFDQPVTVFPDALPNRSYAAKVFYIAPQANRQKGVVLIKVRLENPDDFLKPEMSVRVSFLKEKSEKPIVRRVRVPESALFEKEKKKWVWVLSKEKLTKREVVVSSIEDGQASIASGLEGDEPVVTKALPNFLDEMKVRVKTEAN